MTKRERRMEHIQHLKNSLQQGERAIAQCFAGLDPGECSAIEYFPGPYHELRRQQNAREAQLQRLLETDEGISRPRITREAQSLRDRMRNWRRPMSIVKDDQQPDIGALAVDAVMTDVQAAFTKVNEAQANADRWAVTAKNLDLEVLLRERMIAARVSFEARTGIEPNALLFQHYTFAKSCAGLAKTLGLKVVVNPVMQPDTDTFVAVHILDDV